MRFASLKSFMSGKQRDRDSEVRATRTGAGTGAGTDTAPYFPFERLDVYVLAQEFNEEIHEMLPTRGHAVLRDQLTRSSLSIVANIAEGAGKHAPADKKRFYEIASGSVSESGGFLESALRHKIMSQEAYARLRTKLLRIGQMVGGLIRRFERDLANS